MAFRAAALGRSGRGNRSQLAAPGRGILCMIAGCAVLTMNDALMKLMVSSHPTGQVLFVRGLFAFLPIGLLVWHAGGLSSLRVQNRAAMAGRAFFVVVASLLFITGLKYVPLADAFAMGYAGPLITTALAGPLLAERVGWRRWSAVMVGFAGILIMLRPSGEGLYWAALLPLAATFCGSFRDIFTRRLSASESSIGILFYTVGAVTLAGAATFPFAWTAMPLADMAVLALAALFMCTGHFLQIEAFRYAEAATVAPYRYTAMIWAVLAGYLLWGDLPGLWIVGGGSVVIAAGLYIWHREKQRSAATANVP